ncbi:MAG: hypothetical protein AMJ54_12150 [Deltaproteobacteria bacterium SG8_13]|nr:MAG: hypothetical protein AMJ54_12150 [Deltaproteobacteria bacterium SG8_13]
MLHLPGYDELHIAELAIVIGILLFAGLVHGTLGLGFPMLATPLLAIFTDVRSAMLIVLIPTLVINIASTVRGGNWRDSIGRYWPIAVYGAAGSILGTQLLVVTDPAPYRLLLAAMIFIYVNIERIGVRLKWARSNPQLAYAVFGLVGGFLAGTVNVMVPALVIFALEAGLSATVAVQLFNFCFFFGKISQGLVFTHSGMFNTQVLLATLPLAGVSLLSLLIGMRLQHRIDTETYRRLLKKVLFVIALLLTFQFIQGLFG